MVPELTEQNRKDRVRMCRVNLAKFKTAHKVVTGDEVWIYWKQLRRKHSNKSWVAEGKNARTVVKVDRFEPKMCLIFSSGHRV